MRTFCILWVECEESERHTSAAAHGKSLQLLCAGSRGASAREGARRISCEERRGRSQGATSVSTRGLAALCARAFSSCTPKAGKNKALNFKFSEYQRVKRGYRAWL